MLVNCAFSFCWDAWFALPHPPPRRQRQTPTTEGGTPHPPDQAVPYLYAPSRVPGRWFRFLREIICFNVLAKYTIMVAVMP